MDTVMLPPPLGTVPDPAPVVPPPAFTVRLRVPPWHAAAMLEMLTPVMVLAPSVATTVVPTVEHRGTVTAAVASPPPPTPSDAADATPPPRATVARVSPTPPPRILGGRNIESMTDAPATGGDRWATRPTRGPPCGYGRRSAADDDGDAGDARSVDVAEGHGHGGAGRGRGPGDLGERGAG